MQRSCIGRQELLIMGVLQTWTLAELAEELLTGGCNGGWEGLLNLHILLQYILHKIYENLLG